MRCFDYIKFLNIVIYAVLYCSSTCNSSSVIESDPANKPLLPTIQHDVVSHTNSVTLMLLPQDLRISIVCSLLPHETFKLSQVSKQFYEMINSPVLIQRWQQKYPAMFKTFQNEQTNDNEKKGIDVLDRKHITNYCKYIELSILYLTDQIEDYKKLAASLNYNIELFPMVKNAISTATQNSDQHDAVSKKLLEVRDKDTLQHFLICHMMGILDPEDEKADDARNFIEKLHIENNPQGLHAKIEGLSKGFYGYKRDQVAIRNLMDQLAAQRQPMGVAYKIMGLQGINAFKDFGYQKNQDELFEFINLLMIENNRSAFSSIKDCIFDYTSYVFKKYPENKEVARELIADFKHRFTQYTQRQIETHNEEALELWLSDSWWIYGEKHDPEQARIKNEVLIDQGSKSALWRKIQGLYCGDYGYQANAQEADQMIDTLIAQKDPQAIRHKISSFVSREGGYAGTNDWNAAVV